MNTRVHVKTAVSSCKFKISFTRWISSAPTKQGSPMWFNRLSTKSKDSKSTSCVISSHSDSWWLVIKQVKNPFANHAMNRRDSRYNHNQWASFARNVGRKIATYLRSKALSIWLTHLIYRKYQRRLWSSLAAVKLRSFVYWMRFNQLWTVWVRLY